MAKIIDGKKIAAEIFQKLHEKTEGWMKKGHRAPKVVIISVGQKLSSNSFLVEVFKAAKIIGITVHHQFFNTDTTQQELLTHINDLNGDEAIDGILILLPLPEGIDEQAVCQSVSSEKDIDGLNGKLKSLMPCTLLAVKEMIERSGIQTFRKKCVVVRNSKHCALPIAMMLKKNYEEHGGMDCTEKIFHKNTPQEELVPICLSADIIITATGLPGLIKANMVKPGAAVFDAGMTYEKDPITGKNKWLGDVAFEEVRQVAGVITSVPGGIGPVIVAMMMQNTFNAAQELARKKNLQ